MTRAAGVLTVLTALSRGAAIALLGQHHWHVEHLGPPAGSPAVDLPPDDPILSEPIHEQKGAP